MKRILAVDDELKILESLSLALQHRFFHVSCATNSTQAILLLEREPLPDLVILDINLYNENGLDFCRRIKNDKRWSSIPIIVLSVMADLKDRVNGLNFGADDYICKPFYIDEVVARIWAVIRRAGKGNSEKSHQAVSQSQSCIENTVLKVGLENFDLTPTEARIFNCLAEKPMKLVQTSQIIKTVWNETHISPKTLASHVNNLRKKVPSITIENRFGLGYRLSIESAKQPKSTLSSQ